LATSSPLGIKQEINLLSYFPSIYHQSWVCGSDDGGYVEDKTSAEDSDFSVDVMAR